MTENEQTYVDQEVEIGEYRVDVRLFRDGCATFKLSKRKPLLGQKNYEMLAYLELSDREE